ncbi:MAG: 50S ribosomal protein L24 [Treponema sp. GWB1_62_6]|nr:MAG: 50S ribosomal protein L24 [Treponema sp. GWA1_62_8]OHE69618.1 MAG: 50S ribosomal protein L24 [Treponema sp. GWC1_61_84]OHE71303.1 MAG: 50S ribosomal protein L24 [Treponema sp. GWB1_62_6]OHE71543.1 MAG: 50S ribosomal protein L24 [Treponema sp. RIFOXYC1_FULL_61_9]HCM25047.1 50S ribosomal protein L24 [Treponema sp.]
MIDHKFKLKKDDTVQLIAGKDKGKSGKIVKVIREKDRVIVEGANLVKKAMKRKSQQDRGGIVEIEASIHISNVMIVCKKCGPTRIGFKMENDAKVRVCKKCGEAL